MKKNKFIVLLVLILLLFNVSACQSLSQKEDKSFTDSKANSSQEKLTYFEPPKNFLSKDEREAQKRVLNVSYQKFLSGQFEEAAKQYRQFLQDKVSSPFYQEAQLGLAQTYAAQDKCTEAIPLYRNVIEANLTTKKSLAGEALYLSSFCYEKDGNYAKTLSSLKDALVFENEISPELALAEIPARLAGVYNVLGDGEAVKKYLEMAEKGIYKVVKSKGNSDPVFLSRVYYQMSYLPLKNLSKETFQSYTENLEMLQKFSLKAMSFDQSVWAQKAHENLNLSYDEIWKFIQNVPLDQDLDINVAEKIRYEYQYESSRRLIVLIENLRALAQKTSTEDSSPSSPSSASTPRSLASATTSSSPADLAAAGSATENSVSNQIEKISINLGGPLHQKLFSQLSVIEKKALDFMNFGMDLTPLTEESLLRKELEKDPNL